MFKQEKDWKPELRHEVRGGKGDVVFNHIYSKGTELNQNMRLFAKLVLEPGCSIGWHVHENEDEIYYILSGHVRTLDNGEWIELGPGDATICRSGEEHAMECVGPEPCVYLAAVIVY